jgi:hypothetical protein
VTAVSTKGGAKAKKQTSASSRAFRGLFLPLALSLLNFVGLVISATALGLGNWTTWQFAALFGTLEAGAGIAAVVLPNIWHLPVVELETSPRTRAHLAITSILLPHWGSLARSVAGFILIGLAGYHDGWGPSAALILPLVALIVVLNVTSSLLAARIGVASPETDVVQLMVRWRGEVREARPLSISASLLQFVLGVLTLPLAAAFQPSQVFAEGPGPTTEAFAVTAVAALVTSIGVVAAWWGRMTWRAPQEQQREVEQNA